MRSELAPGSFQEVIEVEEASGSQTVYAVICGNLSARLLGDAERAQKFLMDSAQKLKPDWPAPCVTFLKGELDEAGLLALATDTDKPTEARCFLGLDHLVHRRTEEARTHFQWIRDQGTTNFIEYAIALAELKRLNAAEQ